MSALQEAENAIDIFMEKNVHCYTCSFWKAELFGGICDPPEGEQFYLGISYSHCEQFEFINRNLQIQLEELQEIWLNAWQIVEGFIYTAPHAVDLVCAKPQEEI